MNINPIDVYKTKEYEDFLDRVDIVKYKQFIEKNQGTTIEKISLN